MLCAENEDLKRRTNDMGEMGRKIAEYENRIALLSQEIERLNSIIEAKSKENHNLATRLNEIDLMNKTIGSLQ